MHKTYAIRGCAIPSAGTEREQDQVVAAFLGAVSLLRA